jgi:hypothetical protein
MRIDDFILKYWIEIFIITASFNTLYSGILEFVTQRKLKKKDEIIFNICIYLIITTIWYSLVRG